MYVYYIHRSPLYPPFDPSGDKTQGPATNFAPSVHLPFSHELSGFVGRSGLVVAHTLGKLVHGLTHLDMLNHGTMGTMGMMMSNWGEASKKKKGL